MIHRTSYRRKGNFGKTRVAINISGEIFETFYETLERFPTTLLGSKDKRGPFYCSRTQQYFFDRDRLCFESILHFYQSNGTLKCPSGTPISLFEQECKYFCIPKRSIYSMKRQEGIFPELINNDINIGLKICLRTLKVEF